MKKRTLRLRKNVKLLGLVAEEVIYTHCSVLTHEKFSILTNLSALTRPLNRSCQRN